MVVLVILAATSIHHFSDRAFTLSGTSSPGTSRFYCPRPGLQSTKPSASVTQLRFSGLTVKLCGG